MTSLENAPFPRRGEVWWTRLDPTEGGKIEKTRPCLVITSNVVNRRRHPVVVVPFSSVPGGAPRLQIPVVCADRKAVAVLDQIRSIAKQRLLERIDSVTGEELRSIDEGLRQILELDTLF